MANQVKNLGISAESVINNLFEKINALENHGTSNISIHQFVKDIKLYVVDKTKKFFIKNIAFHHNSSNYLLVRINDQDDNTVCEAKIPGYSHSGDNTVELDLNETNSSGVYGEIVLDFSRINNTSGYPNSESISFGYVDVYSLDDCQLSAKHLIEKKIEEKKLSDSLKSKIYDTVFENLSTTINNAGDANVFITDIIKDIKLSGVNTENEYYLKHLAFHHNATNYLAIRIADKNDSTACEFVLAGYSLGSENILNISLSEVNSSGVKGTALLDFSKITNRSGYPDSDSLSFGYSVPLSISDTKIRPKNYFSVEEKQGNPINDFFSTLSFDRPLIKIGLVAASTFEHTTPKLIDLPANTPNLLPNEGVVKTVVDGINREVVGCRPPYDDDSNKIWRQLYEKFRSVSESPISVNFKDYTNGVVDNEANWSVVQEKDLGGGNYDYGFRVKRTTTQGSYIEFTIPDGYKNCMLIYSRRIGGGFGSVQINGANPSSYPIYGNSYMAEFDPPNNPSRLKAVDTIDFGRVQNSENANAYDNGLAAVCCSEVFSEIDSIAGEKTIRITASDTNGIQIWGVSYWNGTFIWTINASKSGRSIVEQVPYLWPEVVVPKLDYIISQSYGLNIISENRSVDVMKSTMDDYYEKAKENKIDVAYCSYQPFGKSYDSESEWINDNGTNWQDYSYPPGKPKDLESGFVAAARDHCNTKGYPYIAVYEAFESLIKKSSDSDITTGRTMGQLYEHDGQHLRQRGCNVFASIIWNAIKSPLIK